MVSPFYRDNSGGYLVTRVTFFSIDYILTLFGI